MKETFIKVEYYPVIGESCLMPQVQDSLRLIAQEAFSNVRSFNMKSTEDQETLIYDFMPILGFLSSKYANAWNSHSWIDALKVLEIEESQRLNISYDELTENGVQRALKNSFMMMQAGVTTMEDLRDLRKKDRKSQSKHLLQSSGDRHSHSGRKDDGQGWRPR